MLNGSTLKYCFLGIVGTMCFLLISLTLGVAIGKLPMDEYMRLVGTLGISSLFGVIIQAFVHANITEAAKASVPGTTTTASTTTATTPTEVTK